MYRDDDEILEIAGLVSNYTDTTLPNIAGVADSRHTWNPTAYTFTLDSPITTSDTTIGWFVSWLDTDIDDITTEITSGAQSYFPIFDNIKSAQVTIPIVTSSSAPNRGLIFTVSVITSSFDTTSFTVTDIIASDSFGGDTSIHNDSVDIETNDEILDYTGGDDFLSTGVVEDISVYGVAIKVEYFPDMGATFSIDAATISMIKDTDNIVFPRLKY